MANATDIVKKGTVRKTDEFIKPPLSSAAAERTFWPNAMLGVALDGYVDKFDDTQSMIFLGVFRGTEGKFIQPVSADGVYDIDVHQPQRFELAISGVALTDIGKKVYASDDQTGVLTNGGVYSNFIGHVVGVVATGIALVEPVYDGIAAHARFGVARTMAATGAQSVTKWDLNKTILLPNTAAYALTLPAVADTQAGNTLTFVKNTAAAFAVTLTGAGAETIDGSNTLATIDANYDTAILVSTGAAWIVLARDIT